MRRFKTSSKWVSLCSALALAACGGGSGQADTQEGVFLGAPVSGLTYTSPSTSGVTDDEGRFTFRQGEKVRFSLGGTTLGQGPGKAVMTPADLIPGAEPPTTNTDLLTALTTYDAPATTSFVNVIVFLQTLDADDTLENGIQIPSEIPGLLEGTQIDFSRSVENFEQNAPFRALLRRGAQAGLWGGVVRPIRHAAFALDHFLAHTEFTTHFERFMRHEDRGGPDLRLGRVLSTVYSENPFRLEQTTDDGADGNGDSAFAIEWNRHGREAVISFTGSTGDSTHVIEYTPQGDRIRNARYEGTEANVTEYVLDELGLPREVLTDNLADGVIDRRDRITRNAEGQVIRVAQDDGDDGTIDHLIFLDYDEDGRLLLYATDRGADGVLHSRRRVTYDERGRRLEDETDSGGGTAVHRSRRYTYDDVRNIVTIVSDGDGDGPDPESIQRNHHDEAGRITLMELNTNGDGDRRVSYVYDGNVEIENVDRDADGSVDEISRTTKNLAGNQIRFEFDGNADGAIDASSATEYEPCIAFFAVLDD